MEQNTSGEMKSGLAKNQRSIQVHLVPLVLSVIGLAGGALVIIGGGQMLGIRQPGLRVVGAIADSYYHGLGMVFVGFGVVIVATSLWSCFRSLGGGWRPKQ